MGENLLPDRFVRRVLREVPDGEIVGRLSLDGAVPSLGVLVRCGGVQGPGFAQEVLGEGAVGPEAGKAVLSVDAAPVRTERMRIRRIMEGFRSHG